MFEPGPETMGGNGGSGTSAPTGNAEFGSLLSELTGSFQDVSAPVVAPEPVVEATPEVAGHSDAPVAALAAPAPVALLEAPKDETGGLLNELTSAVDQPAEESVEQPVEQSVERSVEAVTVAPSVTTKLEPEMTMSPPRIEPPAFFWKPQRRGFLRRR